MPKSRWILIATVSGVLISGAALLLGAEWLAGFVTKSEAKPVTGPEQVQQTAPFLLREAQAPRPAAPAAPAPRPAPAPRATPVAPAANAPSSPRHVETTEYDSWSVTCEDAAAGGAKQCVGSLRVRNQNRMLLDWQIGSNPDGRWVTAVHIPSGLAVKQGDKTVGGPILVANGVELKFGSGPARRLNFVSCGPRQCLAEAAIDDGFTKEAVANAGGKATITVHTAGGDIPFEVPIKGIDKAIASTRK
jgi:invasion protein IalB